MLSMTRNRLCSTNGVRCKLLGGTPRTIGSPFLRTPAASLAASLRTGTSSRTLHTTVSTMMKPKTSRQTLPLFQPRRFKGGSSRAQAELMFMAFRITARLLGQGVSFLYRTGLYKRIPVKAMAIGAAVPVTALGVFVLTNSEFVPYSNRLHITWLDEDEELELSEESRITILKQEADRLLSSEEEIYKVTWRIVNDMLDVCEEDRIISHSRRQNFNLNIIKSKIPNAFVLPDGSIFVYTGLLPIAETEAGLACVLGHEISHSLARHSSEKIGIIKVLILLYEFIRGMTDHNRSFSSNFIDFLAGTIFQIGLPFAHSRAMEQEADRIGMKLAAKAGYDPAEAAELWRRMMEHEGKPKVLKQKKKEEEDKGWKDEPAPWGNDTSLRSGWTALFGGWGGKSTGSSNSSSAGHNHTDCKNHDHKHQVVPVTTTPPSVAVASQATTSTAVVAGSAASPVVAVSATTPATATVTSSQPAATNNITAQKVTVTPTSAPSGTSSSKASTVSMASPSSVVSSATSTQDMTMSERFKELLSTHPCHARRVEDLTAYVNNVRPDYEKKVDSLRLSGRPLRQSMRYLPYEGVKKQKETPFDYDYGWDDRDFQSALVAQQASSLMLGETGKQIQGFLKSIGRSNMQWGGGH